MEVTKTILLTESGDLEVYEGKRPEEQSTWIKVDDHTNVMETRRNYESRLKSWLSTKQTVKMAEGESDKLFSYLTLYRRIRLSRYKNYPIDVSDIVYEHEGLGYFKEPVVDKIDAGKLDLYTLKSIKFMFELFSDHSTTCYGYEHLCKTIESETIKRK